MGKILGHLNPEPIWRHFEEICAIPRPSGHEQKMTAFMQEFGKTHGIKTHVDEVGNVIFKKPATKGMESLRTVVLQAHMDMVPQKNSDVKHDFKTDPIKPRVVGEVVKATGTTLGSDNGMGICAALAVLESKELSHGPIEVLLTIDEEAGMTGAKGLKPGLLDGDILFNLDNEEEGEICLSCAGGMDTVARLSYAEKAPSSDTEGFRIDVKGLKGGHSGVDIQLNRANANKVLCRLLWEVRKDTHLQISTFEGGNLRNAIPREAFGIVTVPKGLADAFQKKIAAVATIIKQEFAEVDPEIQVNVSKTDRPAKVMDEETTGKVLSAIYVCPHGEFAMVPGMPNVAETSNNLAIVKIEAGKMEVTTMQRSAIETKRGDVANAIRASFELAGAEVEHSGAYPGWAPDFKSPVLKTLKEVYEKKYGKTPKVSATHGGLECGIIKSKYPKMDALAFGPTIRFPHSPDEEVEITTVQKFWDYLTEVLKNIPKK